LIAIMTDTPFKTLTTRINKHWSEADLVAFGELSDPEPLVLLKQAEKWRVDHPKDAVLLIVCATLCIRAELYGKAHSYLQSSIDIRPDLRTYQLLAHLLEHIGKPEQAYKTLQSAVAFAIGSQSQLPKIKPPRLERRKTSDRRR
jgi:HemY protein